MSSAEADDSEYGDIKVFFTASEWKELTIEDKKSHRKSKDNYEAIRRCRWTTRPPFFMCRKLPAPERKQPPQQQDETSREAAAFPSVLDHAEEHGRPTPPSPDLPREGASHGPRISEPSTRGLSTPGLSTPGLSTPGHSTPGHSTPGLSTPVHSTPGLSTPVHSTPGLSTPVHSTPVHSTPALSTPEAMALRTVRRAVSQKTPEPELHVAAVHFAAHEPRTAAAARHPKRAVRSKTHEPGPQDHVSLAAAEPPPAGAAGARGKEAQDGEDRGQKDAAGEASEAPHRCATCGAGFRRAALLRAHMRTHATGTAPEPRTSELKGTSGASTSAATRFVKRSVRFDTHKETELQDEASLSATAPPPSVAAGARVGQAQDGEDRGQQDAAGEAPHRCATCGAAFRRAALLRAHMRTHADDKLDSKPCGVTSADGAGHRMHAPHTADAEPLPNVAAGARGEQAQDEEDQGQQDAAGEAPHRCATCGAAFRRAALLRAHMRTHADDKLDGGEPCGDSSAGSADLQKDVRTHTGDIPHNCQTCGKRFSHLGHLREHMRTHTGERPYKCQTCGKGFAQSTALHKHIRTHTGEKPYKCQTCGKSFTQKQQVGVHMRTHTGDRPYSCQTCGKRFTRKYILGEHIRTHTGEVPYKCTTCGMRFRRSSDLHVHISTHTGERPHKCQTCGKGFTRSSELNKHIRTHTGEKPYKCQTCGKRFTQSSHLCKHLKTHTGERPHKC